MFLHQCGSQVSGREVNGAAAAKKHALLFSSVVKMTAALHHAARGSLVQSVGWWHRGGRLPGGQRRPTTL
ncbi:hypothetical protein F751_0352 [Auxenochlorella protothecoides]|uniref:Uncharacterized protein n=1 Tax=Auxenochlorella protothecoides TaxID=3075 RepID=A0A087SB90_AUXPR|nr:hypothetical protein F751_0352 [Auxenochlorella protothecoides]KFM22994.1 hypothetical protein F751_0352 [Auxenochlorella protothecoides]